jgi:ribosomal protein L31E
MMRMQVMHNAVMRTTFTPTAEVYEQLREMARRSGKSMSSIVNELLRKAIWDEARERPRRKYRVQAKPLGLRRGLDPERLSSLLTDMEMSDFDNSGD